LRAGFAATPPPLPAPQFALTAIPPSFIRTTRRADLYRNAKIPLSAEGRVNRNPLVCLERRQGGRFPRLQLNFALLHLRYDR
jgi:hypothetical protein